ncbi:DUF2953 domain-containing protein [Clostridium saccharoperbutylacetonicum]
MNLFLIVLVILFILFLPIPIKFSIYYSSDDYYIKFYNITLTSKKKDKFKENINLDKKEDDIFKIFYKYLNLKSFIFDLYHSKFKPYLRIKLILDYSFNDAAKTAISYGVLCQIPSLVFILSSIPFKIGKFNFKINPIFEDKFLLKFETSSIIFLSLANIIYITILLLKYITSQGR